MLESMSIRDLRILSYYLGIPVSREYSHIGGIAVQFKNAREFWDNLVKLPTFNIYDQLYESYLSTDEKREKTLQKIDKWLSKKNILGNLDRINHEQMNKIVNNFEQIINSQKGLVKVIREIIADFCSDKTRATIFTTLIFDIINTLNEMALTKINSILMNRDELISRNQSWVHFIDINNTPEQIEKIDSIKNFIKSNYSNIVDILKKLSGILKLETSKTALPSLLYKIPAFSKYIEIVAKILLLSEYNQEDNFGGNIYNMMQDYINKRLNETYFITDSMRRGAELQLQECVEQHGKYTKCTVAIRYSNLSSESFDVPKWYVSN